MKKKIIIFTSSGGGGHEAATKALEGYLGNEYELVKSYIFTDILSSLDPAYRLTFGKVSGEEIYNSFIRKKYFKALNMIARFGNWLFAARKNSTCKLIKEYLLQNKPDLIISVIPFVNSEIVHVAQELNIPFIVVPPDLDTTNYFLNMNNPPSRIRYGVTSRRSLSEDGHNPPSLAYKNFWVITAFNDPTIKNIISSAHIPENQIIVGGFPLRTSFFEPKDTRAIKKHYDIPEDKPVVLVMMGAAGSDTMYNVVQELNNVSFPLHAILALGRNHQIQPKIEALLTNSKLSATMLGVTDHIAELMSVSDLLITKPGPGSICEAIYSDLPMLLDATGSLLAWEEFNLAFVKKHGFGMAFESYADIAPLVEQILKDVHRYVQMKQRLADCEKKKLPDTLRVLIEDILK